MLNEDLVGRLVYSKSGRDRGKPLLIIKVINDRLVMVVDGNLRTIENPKVKNLKHLRVTPRVAREIVDKIARGDPITNPQIRRLIETLVDSITPREGGLDDG